MISAVLAGLVCVIAFIVIVKTIQALGRRYSNRRGDSGDYTGAWVAGSTFDSSSDTSGDSFSGQGGDFGGGGADGDWSDSGSDSGGDSTGGDSGGSSD